MSSGPIQKASCEHCHLLRLPIELQLAIYELIVIEERPLLLNCPCNSSYRGRYKAQGREEKLWMMGKKHPPLQPALTQTCRFIRAETLPIFYSQNIFRASYCQTHRAISALQTKWLWMIGKQNREMLRHLYFYDRNEQQDTHHPKAFEQLKASKIFSQMGGRMEDLSTEHCCAHLVSFGEARRRKDEVPLALQPGVARLRMENEI